VFLAWIVALTSVGIVRAEFLESEIFTAWQPYELPITFTFGTSPSAQLVANFPPDIGTLDFGANDSVALSNLTAALENGTLDDLMFTLGNQSFARPEGYFSTGLGDDPFYINKIPFPTGIDWHGFTIDRYSVTVSLSLENFGRDAVILSIYATPEPSSATLLVIGCVACLTVVRRLEQS
jgi:hypothetical protein